MRRFLRRLGSVCSLSLLLSASSAPSCLLAQARNEAPETAAQAAPGDARDELGPLKYRLLGPAWGGRVSRVAGVPGNDKVYYAATASGGIWKSDDGGFAWKAVSDGQAIQVVSSMGSIAVAPSDRNVVYAGSGEANIRGNVAAGDGIYKSVDAGKTWKHVWKQEGQIGAMAIHPGNPDVAFAAVLGHAFGPNPERGVYRTRDGGKTWQQVLKKDPGTGASDVALDPSNPNIVFAGLWEAQRYPWDLKSGGPGSGLYLSRDGGDSWKQLTGEGLPDGIWGKVGVAVAPSDGRRVYALIEAEEGGLFRSDDGGDSWTRINGGRALRQRPWYFSTITVNPANPEEVWFPQVPMLKSIDGGKTVADVEVPHGDCHDLWIDPKDPKRMILADDGGAHISANGGESWFSPALPIGQFYHVSADSRVPFHVAGSLQDIGSAQGPSNSLLAAGVRNSDWHGVGGGEAGWIVSDPSDPNVVYAGEYGGYLSRYDHRTGQARNISAWPDNPSGHGAEDQRYRFQWTAPIAVSPHDPKVLYHGANVLFRSGDGGQSWTVISPDLTTDDKSKQRRAGGPITGDNTGVEIYCTIFVVAESPLEKGLIWAGTDDGRVHVTRDGGVRWTEVTAAMPGFPKWGTVSMIELSRFDAGTAYAVVDAHRLDDMRPYLWKTADFGRTWKRLDSKLPQDVYLHSVREDPEKKGMLYLATERGVSFSRDGGENWRALKLNLPTVAVHDLVIEAGSLVAGTHGRSIWILDDLAPIRELGPEVARSAVHLLPAPDAVRWSYASAPKDRWSGDNPPKGASIYYWLQEKPKGDVTIEILEGDGGTGRLVRTLSSRPGKPTGRTESVEEENEDIEAQTLSKAPGIQRAVWDLGWSGADLIPDGRIDSGDPSKGPKALPGSYAVRLTVDGKTYTQPLRLRPDPRSRVPETDLTAQLGFALQVRDTITRLTRDVERLRGIRKQLVARNDTLAAVERAKPLVEGSARLVARLDELEGELHNPKAEIVYDILAFPGGTKVYSRLAYLYDAVKDGDGAPTQGARELFAELQRDLEAREAELQHLLGTDLQGLEATARQLDLPHIYVPAGP